MGGVRVGSEVDGVTKHRCRVSVGEVEQKKGYARLKGRDTLGIQEQLDRALVAWSRRGGAG